MNTITTSIVLDDKLSAALHKTATNVANDSKKIEESTKGPERSFAALGESIKKLAALGGALYAFKQGADLIMKMARAADEQIMAQELLRNALGRTSVALALQAAELQKTTRYGDEETMGAQARIAAYIKDEQMIRRLIPVIQDFASSKQMDLASATEIVTKSIVGEVNMLGRYGIQVDGTSKTTERFESVLKRLNDAFGGSSAALGAAGMGPWIEFKNQVGEIGEAVGTLLLPKINAVAKSLGEMITKFQIAAGLSIGNPEKDLANINERIKTEEAAAKKIAAQRDWLEKEHGLLNTTRMAATWDKALKIEQDKLYEMYLLRSKYQKQVYELKGVGAKPSTENPFTDLGEKDTGKPKDKSANAMKEYDDAMYSLAEKEYNRKQKELEDLEANEAAKADIQLSWLTETGKMRNESQTRYDTQVQKDSDDYKKTQDLKLQAAQTFFGGFSALLAVAGKKSKEAAIAAKALAITQAIIETAVAAVKAYQSMAGITVVGPALGALAAAGTIAFGVAQIATISAAKFALGGIVPGSQRTGDNVNARLNSGEMVLNTQQQAQLFDMANGRARGGANITIGGDTIVIQGNASKSTVRAIQQTRQRQLADLRDMIRELSYHGQLSVA